MGSTARRSLLAVAGALTLIAIVNSGILGKHIALLLGAYGALLAGLGAAGICCWEARRTRGVERAWRLWMAIGMAGWTISTVSGTAYRFVFHVPPPNPSPADIGFFTLPVAALVALSCFAREPHGQRRHIRVISVLDSLAVVGSLSVVIRSTDLGAVISANTERNLASALAIAYPTINLILVLFVLVLWLTRRVAESLRIQLALLGLGLLVLAVSNCLIAYLAATKSPEMPFSRVGFIIGPVLIIMAASRTALSTMTSAKTAVLLRRALALLPYTVVAIMVAVVVFGLIFRHELDPIALALGWSVSIIVLAGQMFTLREDRSRLHQLAAAQSQLIYQAEHDPLTGVANRTFFDRQLAQAMLANQHAGEPWALLLIDVDNFKTINDRHGHVAGDGLLVHLAKRLANSVRNSDIVARIGGDEFALLLGPGVWPASVSRRILDSLQQPYLLRNEWVVVSVSIGLIELRDDANLSTQDLLECVDAAMYQAKKFHGPTLVSYDIEGSKKDRAGSGSQSQSVSDLTVSRMCRVLRPNRSSFHTTTVSPSRT